MSDAWPSPLWPAGVLGFHSANAPMDDGSIHQVESILCQGLQVMKFCVPALIPQEDLVWLGRHKPELRR